MNNSSGRFTIRVYGLLLTSDGRLLIAEEMFRNRFMVKFPGGGLEWGESTTECLVREFREETGLEIEVLEHFYTTDFFVASAFDPEVQLLSIYYLVKPKTNLNLPEKELDQSLAEDESFRLVPLSEVDAKRDFTFPVDQHVAALLKERWQQVDFPVS